MRQKIIRILTYFYLVPLMLMVVFNVFNSLFSTTYFELYSDMETARYTMDHPLRVLIAAFLILLVIYSVYCSKWFQSTKKLPWISVGFGVFISGIIVFLVRGMAITDGRTLTEIAAQFIQGNYQAFEQGEYLYMYSFQIGLVAFLEGLYHLAGVQNDLAFQILNVIAIGIFLQVIQKITWEVFENMTVQKLEALLAMGLFPLFLFSTFVYGDILGWAFGVSAVYCIIRYLKTDQWKYLLVAANLLAIGIWIKSNMNILLVAAVIVLILDCIQKHKCKPLLWIVILTLLPQLLIKGTEAAYVKRASLSEYPAGIPKIAWVAMSWQEGDEGGYAPGWYNSYNWSVYVNNGYDREKAEEAALENLRGSVSKLVHEQRYALRYVYKKFTSQWNAPTFQALISNEWSTRHHNRTTALGKWFIFGTGRSPLFEEMNVYHFLIFLCAAVGIVGFWKHWNLIYAYLSLNIFGGFLFHMIWEAQSRYVLGYFVLLLPFAGYGCKLILEGLDQKTKRIADRKREEDEKA